MYLYCVLKLICVMAKQEIEKLWKMVDAAHDKESRARDTINQLKLEIANLTKLVEQGAGLNFGQDSSVQELMKQKEELTKERDTQLEDIVKVRSFLRQLRTFFFMQTLYLICSLENKWQMSLKSSEVLNTRGR